MVRTTDDKEVGQYLATIAKDEKLRFPVSNRDETLYLDHIRYAESENNYPDDQ